VVVSRKQVEVARRELEARRDARRLSAATRDTDPSLPASDWTEPPEFGVTESTTRELR